MRRLAAAGVGLLVAVSALAGAPAAVAGPVAGPVVAAPGNCKTPPGGQLSTTPWAQQRLDFQRAWSVTKGRFVRSGRAGPAGRRVLVAVVDSGLDPHPQLLGLARAPGINSVSSHQTGDVTDCNGHGTGVTSIIAAHPVADAPFVGVAPDVQILPIKQTDQKNGSGPAVVRAIDDAIAAHAQVVNLSLSIAAPQPALRAAVQRASKAGLILVAAAGNDGQTTRLPAYPAAYSPEFPNVIAVSAIDANDGIGNFSTTGNYVSVAAPGTDIEMPAAFKGYTKQSGTSFAAPYVTGTAALVLAANPDLSPEQVRNRIEATADPPAAAVPDPKYGYGIVNPYLAVTAVRDDTASVPTAAPRQPVPARAAPAPTDRHLQHLALAAAIVLLGLAVLAAAGAAVLRGRRRPGRQPVVG